MLTRRQFVWLSAIIALIGLFPGLFRKMFKGKDRALESKNQQNDYRSEVFIAKNGTPERNVAKVIQMMGGIEKYVQADDIVILKPNAQWWNQGRTNLAAMKGFMDLVLEIPNFSGEIIIAENHHFMDESLAEDEKDNVRGWTHYGKINGTIDGINHNINSLIEFYQKRGFKNVSKCHWRDGGPKRDIWGNGQNGGVVNSVCEGDGYIWSETDYTLRGLLGLKKWKVKMSYPVFTSRYSGITIDLKNGAYRRNYKGNCVFLPNKLVKLVNFAVLNDHGTDTGITSCIKNYMGITDLSCGSWGLQPEGYVNVHQCGEPFYAHAKAGPLGYFMKEIRKADVNIVTAEWVGWGSRTNIDRASRLRTILAGTDPVAVDYCGAKYFVYPLSKENDKHNPDNRQSSISKFLSLALKALGEGSLDRSKINIHQYDFESKQMGVYNCTADKLG